MQKYELLVIFGFILAIFTSIFVENIDTLERAESKCYKIATNEQKSICKQLFEK